MADNDFCSLASVYQVPNAYECGQNGQKRLLSENFIGVGNKFDADLKTSIHRALGGDECVQLTDCTPHVVGGPQMSSRVV